MSDTSDDAEDVTPGQTQGKLVRRTREFQVLQRASEAINSTLDLDEIYESALRTMQELFEFHHAIILLLDPDGEDRKSVV